MKAVPLAATPSPASTTDKTAPLSFADAASLDSVAASRLSPAGAIPRASLQLGGRLFAPVAAVAFYQRCNWPSIIRSKPWCVAAFILVAAELQAINPVAGFFRRLQAAGHNRSAASSRILRWRLPNLASQIGISNSCPCIALAPDFPHS